MQELRGITGDHLMQPPGFNFNEWKSGAPLKGQVACPRTKSQRQTEPRGDPGLGAPDGNIFLPFHSSVHEMNAVLRNQQIQSSQMCVLKKNKKIKNEEIEFEEHSTFMRWAHLRSLETFLWCKGFLNKGFHWPVGSRHAHTDILLLAIP